MSEQGQGRAKNKRHVVIEGHQFDANGKVVHVSWDIELDEPSGLLQVLLDSQEHLEGRVIRVYEKDTD